MIRLKHFGLAFLAELALALALGVSARAQAPAPAPGPGAPEQGGQLQQITVTGYVIPRIGQGPQPVVTYDRDYVDKLGYQSVTDIVRALPFNNAALAPLTNSGINSSPASSAPNLRGLNVSSTLTLVDGHRFPNFPIPLGGTLSFVDLNSIPLAAVERIEILKDGASAVYGDDAVAGVVNIILKDEYNGADIYNYYSITDRGDAETYHGQFTGGVSKKLWSDDSKLSIVTAFDYFSSSPIESIDRWYAYGDKSKLAAKYPDTPTQFLPPAGSFLGSTTGTVYNVKERTVANVPSNFTTGSDNTVNQPFIPNNAQLAGREERYGGLVKVKFEPTNWLKFYDTLIVQRSEENGVTPNQGLFSSSIAGDKVAGTQIFIPANNPFNPSRFFGTPEALTGRGQSFDEFGPWHETTITRTIFNVVGATVQLPHSWVVDASYVFGESDSTQTYTNAALNDRLQLALQGQLPGHIGQFYNPFTDQRFSDKGNGSLVDAIRSQQFQDARTDISTWAIHGGGPIFEYCPGQVTVAGGVEYRDETLIIANDPNSTNRNIIAGNFLGRGTNARRNVFSAYYQVTIPILGEKWSWPFARHLEVVLSERYDDYSDVHSSAKPQIAVLYRPFEDLAFRGTYSEAFVAPSLAQLFLGTPLEFQATVTDPHPPAGTNPRLNILYLNSANPNLKPENAYEYYAEAIWTPGAHDPDKSWWGWANGFTAYIDWFQIELRNAIAPIPANTLVSNPTAFPGASVIRDPSGRIAQATSPFFNLGTVLTDGIDFGASYVSKEYNWGKLDLEVNATYIYNYAVKTLVGTFPPGSPKAGQQRFQVYTADDQYHTAGNFNGSGPDFKLLASAFWSKTVCGIDTVRTGFSFNYLDSEADIFNNRKGSAPNLNSSLDSPGYVHLIGSYTTVDYQLAYLFGKPSEVTPETPKPGYNKEGKAVVGEKAISPKMEGSRWGWRSLLADTTFTFGIRNIFDAHPPLSIDQNSGAGFDFNNADPFGRFYYFSIEKKF